MSQAARHPQSYVEGYLCSDWLGAHCIRYVEHPCTRLSQAVCDCSQILELLKQDVKPRDIMTRAAFENAMVIVMALGGSTNAVLHLLAMARACHVPLSLDDFQVSRLPVPVLDNILISVCRMQEF